MVFRDRTGTVWNQVDTVLSDETIDAVRARQQLARLPSRGSGHETD